MADDALVDQGLATLLSAGILVLGAGAGVWATIRQIRANRRQWVDEQRRGVYAALLDAVEEHLRALERVRAVILQNPDALGPAVRRWGRWERPSGYENARAQVIGAWQAAEQTRRAYRYQRRLLDIFGTEAVVAANVVVADGCNQVENLLKFARAADSVRTGASRRFDAVSQALDELARRARIELTESR